MRKAYTIKSGLIAILIYILIIFIAIFAFVQNTKDDKSQGGKEQVIKVDMSGIDIPSVQKSNDKPQNQKLPNNKEASVSKKIENTPEEKKELIKKELAKKEFKEIGKLNKPSAVRKKEKPETNTTIKKTTAVKKPIKETSKIIKDTASLFETIDAKAPNISAKKTAVVLQKQTVSGKIPGGKAKATNKASDLIGNASSAKSSGVEDDYKSKVKSILNGWPAQSDFAGNKAKIKFVIEPSGRFEFDVVSQSSNEEFNKGLIQYLKQLQKVGFGAHGGGRAYIFDVDFIAER